ncbi:MAG TPA: histidine kinase N-terminal domain-containing protein [Candidatus Avipropionibacterium avicola]|uniref:histidine kinase n=1 Tax=Candidatus Avipropionibacterium avicola TaxID=2840701 RepID=A0A9D1GX55_9ACTN|nr:histidine kinase N-terminal domain-containing protein [Candidatus Avipropionibacterium avicola]
MPSLAEVVDDHTSLEPADQSRLELLVRQWHLVADLAFSDLVLWVPDTDPNVFWAAAQVRPATGPTALFEDVVGDPIAYVPEHLVTGAFVTGEITRTSANKLHAGTPVDVIAIPIPYRGRIIGVLERHTNQLGVRRPSGMELQYVAAADDLATMVAEGSFPVEAEWLDPNGPHVGDGMIRLDPDGDVIYASPNAVSAYRRLGWWLDLEDVNLSTITSQMAPTKDEERHEELLAALSGRYARDCEADTTSAQVLLRSIPMQRAGERIGALVLCKDVTDLRRRERELVTKDATIREMHHRVKNNLQTVAALLRMQARRIDSPEATAALQAAMARVSSIAVVHEVLSQVFDKTVDFDEVADQILRMLATVATTESAATVRRVGSFGTVSADVATSLSLVVTELCQNAIEHGLNRGPGQVDVVAEDLADSPDHVHRLRVRVVTTDGAELPEGFDLNATSSLGLSIVQTMVADLQGEFRLENLAEGHGTCAEVVVPRGL